MKWHRLYKESVMDSEYQKLIRLIIAYKQADKGSIDEKEYMKEIKSIIKPFFTKGDISHRIDESGGKTAILHQSWRTGKWTWEDAYWRSTWREEFDTKEYALRSAKEQGYMFAYTPSTSIARPIDVLLEDKVK